MLTTLSATALAAVMLFSSSFFDFSFGSLATWIEIVLFVYELEQIYLDEAPTSKCSFVQLQYHGPPLPPRISLEERYNGLS
jgi:hypothetical protein